MARQTEEQHSLLHRESSPDILHRRQITAMAVAVAMVVGCLAGAMQHPRIVSWPMDVDAVCLSQVRQGVDINTANWPQLAQLPGIGESIARRIVEYRETRGTGRADGRAFTRPGDLQRVSGIGQKIVMRIAPFVRCEDGESFH